MPWYFGGDTAPEHSARPTIKILSSNVYYLNHRTRQVQDLVNAESPDVVGLIEVTASWMSRLRTLHAEYPYRFEAPDEEYVGLALYSRLPFENARILALPGEPSTPAIAATLKAPGGDIEIVLVHPTSPESAEYIARRNEQILAIAEYVAAEHGPVVVAGDFNVTMWNTGYRPLVEVANLHNARQGRGVAPSWPSLGKIGVPIDHILGSHDVLFRNFRVLGDVGSDHYPISAEFSTY